MNGSGPNGNVKNAWRYKELAADGMPRDLTNTAILGIILFFVFVFSLGRRADRNSTRATLAGLIAILIVLIFCSSGKKGVFIQEATAFNLSPLEGKSNGTLSGNSRCRSCRAGRRCGGRYSIAHGEEMVGLGL